MENENHPTFGHGKICYVEIPAHDLRRSADFYQAVFGWHVRTRGDSNVAFDDGVGEVSGSWVLGRKPTTEAGLLIHIMVDSVAASLEAVVARGGSIARPIGGDPGEITARFADPAGNVIGLYQEPLGDASPGREIVSTRVVAAPRELVWKAWTDPKHLAQWWGPSGFTNTFHECDVKPGGHWRFIMHGPDGKDYQNHSVFLDVTKPARIVFDHFSGPQFLVVVTFDQPDGGTRISFRMIFPSAAECKRLKPLCVPSNEQNFDRLEATLKKMS